mmetsp:Transcript_9259/g.12733  ORF Transcript_9259/g.12733 Transcript_9259/m.12733 type:complete len:116 (+) Transcript_9259:371-718(+)
MTGLFWCSTGDVSVGGPNVTCVGQTDWLIAKYDSNGQFIWQTSIGGPLLEYPQQVATDHQNNVITVGSTSSSWWILNGTNITGSTDCLVVKYNSDGQLLWYSKQNNKLFSTRVYH